MSNYKRFDGETAEELIYRICSEKDTIGTWSDVAKIINEILECDYTESKYRKEYQNFQKMFTANQNKFSNDVEVLEDISAQRRELEREKVKFRDERNAWQKQNRLAARLEQKIDYLEEVIQKSGRAQFKDHKQVRSNPDSAMIVCLSDLHIGATGNDMWGKYDSDIARERLEEYLYNVVQIGNRHSIKDIIVLGIGDMISNSIHKTIQVTNRENVIDQIILASEYIAEFIGRLCGGFNVKFINVSGNHSRLCDKEDALKDERLDDLIGWYVSKYLGHLANFTYLPRKDVTLGEFEACGNKYFVVHGDYDNFSKQGAADLVMVHGYKPAGIFFGHRHVSAMQDVSDIKLIQSGCLCGSVGDYCASKRLTGKPSQTVVICNSEGVECIYPVTLH